MATKPTKPKAVKSKASPSSLPKLAAKPTPVSPKKPVKPEVAAATEWLQDASIEVPVPASSEFAPGQRELEFSIGLRQQDADGLVRSELRGRALVHAQGTVLALVEASYVNISSKNAVLQGLPQHLYSQLRPQMERLLALAGHTPPLPASLDQIS